MEAAAAPARIGRGSLSVLLAMSLALVAITLDLSALNVAVPAMERAFHSSVGTMQWALNGYALAFAVLLVTGGRLADLLGRRRIFVVGTLIFALAALAGGLAADVWWMIGARVVMGVGAALMLPAATGIMYAALPASRAGLAGAFVVGSFGIGQSIGPLIGGALTEYLSWRWVFFVDIPAAAIALYGALREVPADAPGGGERRIDYGGIATLSLAVFALLFALDQGTDWGWSDPRVVGALVVSALSFGAFVLVERRAGEHALIPPDVVRSRPFRATGVVALLGAPVFFSALFYLPQFMDKLRGSSAFEVGVEMLPFMGALAAASFAAAPVYNRLGPRVALVIGLTGMVAGCAVLGFVSGPGYLRLLPGMVLVGAGLAFFASALTTAAVTALADSERSLAGAIIFTLRVGGGAVGLGLMTAIVASSSGFLVGFRTGFRVNAAFALAALLVTLLAVRKR
jgi:EmrB/QacA subfamily drug resistance transporter